MNNLLIIDDDKFIVRIVKDRLAKEGFQVTSAEDSISGLNSVYEHTPEIILLDVELPGGKNGTEICRLLRNDTRTSHVPIIMLTSRRETDDIVTGLEAGADDYMTKPFDPAELVARVKTHLRRAKQEKSFNPLTGLPGNLLIEQLIKDKVKDTETPFAVLYLDLDNFKAYNDVYGFLRGDEVLKLLAHIFEQVTKEMGNRDDFVGHIGGDDFIILTTPDKVDTLCEQYITRFDSTIPLFYSSEDRKKGYITTVDRQGAEVDFPIMTLSIAVISSDIRTLTSHWQVAEIASELKKYVKSLSGSNYVKDRRGR
ncbi:MAG TPA: response regulator [Bacillota bacterium]|nr:response regulator [Bacillota bacterium]